MENNYINYGKDALILANLMEKTGILILILKEEGIAHSRVYSRMILKLKILLRN